VEFKKNRAGKRGKVKREEGGNGPRDIPGIQFGAGLLRDKTTVGLGERGEKEPIRSNETAKASTEAKTFESTQGPSPRGSEKGENPPT